MRIVRVAQREAKARAGISDAQAEREALWPQGSDDERCLRSLNEYRRMTSAEQLPKHVCAVCGELHIASDIVIVGTTDEADQAVRGEYQRLAFICTHGSDDMRLSPQGVLSRGEWQMCKNCRNSIRRREVPQCSALNDLFFGEIPPELQDMTILEQLLVSQIRFKLCVIRFQCDEIGFDSGLQRGIKGHAIAFPQVRLHARATRRCDSR